MSNQGYNGVQAVKGLGNAALEQVKKGTQNLKPSPSAMQKAARAGRNIVRKVL